MADKESRNKVVSGLFWKFAESACADIVSFGVSVILARLLLPADYGEVGLVNVFIVLANVFVVNGLGTALVQKKDADELDFSSVFYANLLLSLVLYGGLWFASPFIADFYDMPHLCIVLRVLGIKVPIAAINSIQNAYVSREMIFKKFFFATIIGTIISAIVGIYMAYAGFGVWALVAQILTNTIIDTIVLFITVRWFPRLMFSLKRLKELFNYGWKILVSSLIKTGYGQLSNLLIGKLYSKEDLAFYNRGQKYPDLIVTDINSAISSVLFPAIAKKQDDIGQVKAMTRRAMKTSTFVMTPLLIGLAAIAEPLVRWMLTDKWLPCVPFIRVCCIYCMMQPIQTANLQAIRAIGRSDVILKLDIVKRGAGLVLLLLMMRISVMGVAVAPVFMSLIATCVNVGANKKLIAYSYKEQFLDLIPNFLLAGMMGVAVYTLSLLLAAKAFPSLSIVVISTLVGAAFYLGLSFVLRLEPFEYLRSITIHYIRNRSL